MLRQQSSGCRAWGWIEGWRRIVTTNGNGACFGDDANVLIRCSDDCTSLNILYTKSHFKWINIMVSVLYLNKGFFFYC